MRTFLINPNVDGDVVTDINNQLTDFTGEINETTFINQVAAINDPISFQMIANQTNDNLSILVLE